MSDKSDNSVVKVLHLPLTHVCIYKNCPNRIRVKGISYFAFPIKDVERTKKWLINSGNAHLLDIDIRKLKYSLICERHFLPEYLSNNCFSRMLIKKSKAVPIQYVEGGDNGNLRDTKSLLLKNENLKLQPRLKRTYCNKNFKTLEDNFTNNTKPFEVKRTYSRKEKIDKKKKEAEPINTDDPVHSEIYNLSEDPNIINEEKTAAATIQMKSELNTLRNEVSQLKMKLKATTDLCIRMKKKKFTSYVGVVDDLLFNKSIFVKTFVRMQTYKTQKKEWSINEKHFAISFYRRSPSIYKFFLLKLKFVLPGIKTVKYWMKENNPRVNDSVDNKFLI